MGSNINEFVIKIEFAHDGTVDGVCYWDQEGCGHEHSQYLGRTLDDVIQYHLKHYRESHDMMSPRRCGMSAQVTMPGRVSAEYAMCILEPHGPDTKHTFEVS